MLFAFLGVFSNRKSKMKGYCRVFLTSLRSVDEKHWMCFQSKKHRRSPALCERGVTRVFHSILKKAFSDSGDLAEEH